ncbi:MAG: hypothetical protein JO213_15380, partial [Alphaproteobacteria bacterium]|nr:hypothetical protein [Alphaproteobacteria bacterium]
MIALGAAGVAGLYGLALWFDHPVVMAMFWLLLPTVVGRMAVAIWEAVRRQKNRSINTAAIDRWTRRAVVGYLCIAMAALFVIDRYALFQPSMPSPIASDIDDGLRESCPFA